MTSYSGSVAYLEYVSKTDKGDVKKGDVFNGVFGLGMHSEARTAFTSQVIVETVGEGGELSLEPVASNRFAKTDEWGKPIENGKDIKVIHKNGDVEYKAAAKSGFTKDDKVAYFSNEFQMEHVPAEDIPTIGPRMNRIALVAEPRRIAVRYDQITAFQA